MSISFESASYSMSAARAFTHDAVRQRIVRLIFVFYWLLIFEGALRKWGLPQLEQVFFFVRVPVAFVLYWTAFRHRRWPRTSAPMLSFYLLAVAVTILVPVQLVAGGYEQRYILFAGYGWVNYFFYVPLAFLIAEHFQIEDLRRLMRHAAWLALASCPIVIMQFSSPRRQRYQPRLRPGRSESVHESGCGTWFCTTDRLFHVDDWSGAFRGEHRCAFVRGFHSAAKEVVFIKPAVAVARTHSGHVDGVI